MSEEQKKELLRIGTGILLFAAGMLLPEGATLTIGVFLGCYLLVGWDIVAEAAEHIFQGKALDECFLMTIATVGAFALGAWSEGVAVMLFFRIGEWFEEYATARFGGISCSAIVPDGRPDATVCGGLVSECYGKVLTILVENGIDPGAAHE